MATELASHLSSDALRARHQAAAEPVERTRFHALWLLSQGRSRSEVAALVGRRPNWVRVTLLRYKTAGPDGLADGRHGNPGQKPLLNAEQEVLLEGALQQPCADGTPWSGPKVARWMSDLLGKRVRPQRGWEALIRHGYTGQRPRPQHRGADAEAQEGFPSRPAQSR